MSTFTGALCAAGTSCLIVLFLRLLLPGHGGLGSLFRPEQEPDEGSRLGGVFLLAGIIAGMLAGRGSFSGNALFALLITAAAVLIGFIDDLVTLQDRRGEGIVPWLKALLLFLLMLSASIYLSFSDLPGRIQLLPISCASSDMFGWYLLLSLPLLLGRILTEKKMYESAGFTFFDTGCEAAFWCFVFCLAGETGAQQWFQYRNEFAGMASFSGSVAGALLGISVFNPEGRVLHPGMSGYYGIAVSVSLMALCSGWLILLPLAALWPFCCGIFALMILIRSNSASDSVSSYLLSDYFTAHGMTVQRLQSTIRWLTLLGILMAAFLYTL